MREPRPSADWNSGERCAACRHATRFWRGSYAELSVKMMAAFPLHQMWCSREKPWHSYQTLIFITEVGVGLTF